MMVWRRLRTGRDKAGSETEGRRPAVPSGIRVYAVGDVHGRSDLLGRLHAAIDEHRASRPTARCLEVYLGDYVDRGPGSFDVIEMLTLRARSREVVSLAGNHEELLLRALRHPERLPFWARNGGLRTLQSYGVDLSLGLGPEATSSIVADLRARLPASHRRFLASLCDSFRCGDYFFTHAGVRPGVPLERQERTDLLWIRDEFLQSEADFGAVVVHGHTPVAAVDVRVNRVNVDTGAFATHVLSCLVLEAQSLSVITSTTSSAETRSWPAGA